MPTNYQQARQIAADMRTLTALQEFGMSLTEIKARVSANAAEQTQAIFRCLDDALSALQKAGALTEDVKEQFLTLAKIALATIEQGATTALQGVTELGHKYPLRVSPPWTERLRKWWQDDSW